MKKYIRKFYEQFYLGCNGAARGLGGKPLALELGYPAGLIDVLPAEIWDNFLPCGDVFSRIVPRDGDRILNLGGGAGVDSILLKLSVRAAFTVVNLDIAFSALVKARRASAPLFSGSGFDLVCADGASAPFAPGSFDGIILNGVFNLFPDKRELIAEINRVLKPGGIVAGADLCRTVVLPGYFADEPDAWAWCMSGAVSRLELVESFEAEGFSVLDTMAENMDEFFDRVVFTFRKKRLAKGCLENPSSIAQCLTPKT